MPRWASAICIPCLSVGLGLVLFSATTMAADGNGSPSWSLIATGLVGIVVAMVGAYAKGLERRINDNERGMAATAANLTSLREMVLTKYHDDTEIERLFVPVNLQLAEFSRRQRQQELLLLGVHNRLDQAGIGVRPRIPTPDDGN